MIAVRYDVPGKPPMRGFATAGGPDLELVTISHTMPDGSTATEVVWLPVMPAAAPSDPATAENRASNEPA